MLNAVLTQFRLGDDGVIRFQPLPNNPLPGEEVARAVKGQKILEPGIEVINAAGQDPEAVGNLLKEWVRSHIRSVLEPLSALEQTEGLPEPVRGICEKLYNGFGVLPREDVESLIKALDPEMRQTLRAKQVRLGPVIVFLPALNKPAGVRLRGMLWALWNDKPLPPPLPHDGVVSVKVDEGADKDFYRAIGYPVYGPRAIRIDMLDRVINAVYDSAKDGKFQAQHKMAEWLGCQINDLYEVLAAMGHRKIHDPAENKDIKPESEKTETVDEASTQERPAEEAPAAQNAVEVQPETKAQETAPVTRPELATFALKKGKAFEKKTFERKERKERKEHKEGKPKAGPSERPKDKRKEKRRKEHKPRSAEPRVISAGPKPKLEDSPFAILEQLKVRKDGS